MIGDVFLHWFLAICVAGGFSGTGLASFAAIMSLNGRICHQGKLTALSAYGSFLAKAKAAAGRASDSNHQKPR